jgi:hypothetical protein
MSTLNPDTLDVTTFETTTDLAVVSPVTPGTVCDSPWCVQTWNPPCPATTVAV